MYAAFKTLQFDRDFGAMGGAFPLTFAAIDRYARRYDVEGEAFDSFLALIRALDGVWLELFKSRNEGAAGG